jgi:hypothetical protein
MPRWLIYLISHCVDITSNRGDHREPPHFGIH